MSVTSISQTTSTTTFRHDADAHLGRNVYVHALLIVCAYAIVVLWFHTPLWWPGETKRALGGDVSTAYWQDTLFVVESLRRGELPLWNPFERGGYPFFADPQASLYTPLAWCSWLVGLATGSNSIALQEFRQLATPVLAATGLHLFLRTRGLSHGACALAGSVLALGAFARQTITMATYWPWAYLGFSLATFEQVLAAPGLANARRLALALILLGTSGYPPTIFYALLFIVPYTSIRMVQARNTSIPRWTFAASCVALLACLVVFAPMVEHVPLTDRADRDLGYVLSDAVKFEDLTSLLDPNAAGKRQFNGVLVLGCAALGLVARARDASVIVIALVGMFGFVLATGSSTPVLPWLAEHVPGFDLFRVASRYAILLQTSLALLAAFGLDHLLRWFRLQRALPIDRRKFIPRWSSSFAAAIVGLQLIDLHRLTADGTYVPVPDPYAGRELANSLGTHRVYNEWSLGPRPGSRLSIRDWRGRGQDPMAFARYQDVEAAIAQFPERVAHFEVQHVLTGSRNHMPTPRIRRPDQTARFQRIRNHVYRVESFAPAVYWTEEIVEADTRGSLWVYVGSDPGTIAVIERDVPQKRSEPRHEPSSGHVLARANNRLSLEVVARSHGMVVINEVFYAGWSAHVDGEPSELLQVNYLLRGVEVGPGRHVIELRFQPRLWLVTFPMFVLVVVLLVMPGTWLKMKA